MTTQSQQSTQASATDGTGSFLAKAVLAQRVIEKRRALAPQPKEPQRVVAKFPATTSISRPSATPTASELEAARRVRTAAGILAASGLPRRHLNLATRDATGDAWSKALRGLTGSLSKGMTAILSGDRGRGKTQMAVAASRDFADRGKTVKYIRAMDLFRDLREGMKDNRESARIKHFTQPSLLIIDDAHERGDTEYETRSMVNLVDHRYGDEKATLLITNQSREAFAKSVGPSIVSRIVESGVFIACDWKSYRGAS